VDFGSEAFVGSHMSIAKAGENDRNTAQGGEYGGAVGWAFETILDIGQWKHYCHSVVMRMSAPRKAAVPGRTQALEPDKTDGQDREG